MPCDFEFRGDALERTNAAQMGRLLAFAAGSMATSALVCSDFVTGPSSPHGEGTFLLVDWKLPGGRVFTTGISPSGEMHS